MKKSSELKKVYLYLLIAAIPLVALMMTIIELEREQMAENRIDFLHSLLSINEKSLDRFLGNYQKQLEVMAGDKDLHKALQNSSKRSKVNFETRLHRLQETRWGDSHHLFVANTQGEVVISPFHAKPESNHLGQKLSEFPYFKQALEESVITDFFGFSEASHYHQLILVPIKKDGKTLGVLVSELSISKILSVVGNEIDFGDSSEIFLLTPNRKKVVESKDHKIDLVENTLINSLSSDQIAVAGELKQEGKELLVVYKKSPKHPWIIGAHWDKDEILAETNQKAIISMLVLLICIGLFFLASFRIVALVKRPVLSASGDLDHLSNKLHVSSEKMESVSNSLLKDAVDLSSSVEQNKGQLDHVCEVIVENSSKVTSAMKISNNSKQKLDEGRNSITEITESVKQISEANLNMGNQFKSFVEEVRNLSHYVGEIRTKVNLINDIVFQTKLLSFNASVEAARAGDSGKGFSVVAEEIGNLASMSGKSAVEINSIVDGSLEKIDMFVANIDKVIADLVSFNAKVSDNSLHKVHSAEEIFHDIFGQIEEIHTVIQAVHDSSQKNMKSISEVSSRFGRLSDIADNTSKLANENMEFSKDYQVDSKQLSDMTQKLKTDFAA